MVNWPLRKGGLLLIGLALNFITYAASEPRDTVKRWQGMSLRTNLLWDAVAEPNIGLEFPVGKHVSLGLNAGIKTWPRWLFWDNDNVQNTRHWRNYAVVPEVRYYFDQVYDGFFVGGDAIYTHFNVGNVTFPFHMYPEVENHRVQGSFWGGGLFAGYSWWLGQYIRIEAEAGVAAGLAAYDKFDCAHCGTKVAEVRKPAVVPKLGVNIAWNPVAKDKRPKPGMVVSGRDTLTVLSAPVAFVVHLGPVKAPATTGDLLAKDNTWVIPIENYRPFDYLTRPGKDSLQYVTFPVNSKDLDRNYGNNAATLDRIQAVIEKVRDEGRTREVLVSIVGLASIDGPQDANDTLAQARARAVARYFNERTFVSMRNFDYQGKGEAWDWFRAQLEAIPDGGEGLSAQEVKTLLDIVYEVSDADERERRIKAQPALYKKVAEKLLGDQRNSGYIRVYYGNAPDPATETFNHDVMELLKAKRYQDVVAKVEQDPKLMACTLSDAEAMNAYGVALYFTALDQKDTARETRALELLRRAAQLGSAAAAENLKGTETYGPARKEFEAWKEVMKDNER